jgi:hypothetical protein
MPVLLSSAAAARGVNRRHECVAPRRRPKATSPRASHAQVAVHKGAWPLTLQDANIYGSALTIVSIALDRHDWQERGHT